MSGLVALGSVKGSPGVTTVTVGLAAGWPMRPGGMPVVAVEADPAGGSIAGWYELPAVSGGLVTWAAQARSGRTGLAGHVRQLPGGVDVVAAPVDATAARGAVEVLAAAGAVSSVASSVTVLADVGRLDVGSAAGPLVGGADLLVVVARPEPVELARVAAREAQLTAAGRRECVLLLVGEPAWPVDRVADSVGLPVLGVMPDDPRGAALIAGRPGGRRAGGHGPLARACRQVARDLADLLAVRPTPLPPPPLVQGQEVRPAAAMPAGRPSGQPVAGRAASVLVPAASPRTGQGNEGHGWVPSTTVRRPKGGRR